MRRRSEPAWAVLAFIVILLLVLAGCGGPKEGYVVSKRVNPPMDWIWLMPTYSTRCYSTGGKYGGTSCSTYQTGGIPVPQHRDECPELTLKPDPAKKDTKTLCVDHQTYDRVNIGDFYKEQKK